MSNHRVNSEMDSKVLAKSGSKRKRDYRYLSLLGASLFSISLMQLNTTTVHADTTATSQATVVKSQAASSNAASETTTTSSVANSAAASTTSSATVQAATAMADSVTTPSAAASSAASNDSSASTTVANTSNTASAAATAASSAAADSQAASSATSSAATAANDTTTSTDYASATPITDNPKAVVPDTSQKLSSTYTFIPKFNGSGTTAVSVIGAERETAKANTISASLVGATKGQVGFKYTNVGYDADGNSMDLNIIFTDWGRLSELGDAYVETYTNKIYSNFPGAGWVDVKYQFVRSGTETQENVSGLMTLTDIDGSQTVSMTDSQWANIDNVYIPQSEDPLTGQTDNWLRYAEDNGYMTITSPSENSPSDAEYAMLMFTYTKQSSLTFRYSDGHDVDTPTKMTVWGVNYIPQKPLATETIPPILKVIDNSGTASTANTLSQGQSSYQYQITQQIPDEWSQFYYGNVNVTAALPGSVLDYKVTDADGNDVTSYFTNNSTGSQLNLAATADALQNADFYGQRYIFTVTVSAPADTTSFDQYTVHSTTTIDGIAKDSGTTTTTLFNQHQITVHYYKKGTTEKLAPDEIVTVVDGQTYTTPEKTFKGYKVSSQINTTGVYDGDVEAIYYYAVQKGTVMVYYLYKSDGETFEYKEKKLTGTYGDTYTTKPVDLLNNGGNWILKSTPSNASGTFDDGTIEVDYYYGLDKERDVDHIDGSETYIDVTADNRLGILDQTHADGSETLIERRNFDKNEYRVSFFNKNGTYVKCQMYKFGKSYVFHDKTDGNVYNLKISKAGAVTLSVSSEKYGVKYDSISVSKTGKILRFTPTKKSVLAAMNITHTKRKVLNINGQSYRASTRKDMMMQRKNAVDMIKGTLTLPQTGEKQEQSGMKAMGLMILTGLSSIFVLMKGRKKDEE